MNLAVNDSSHCSWLRSHSPNSPSLPISPSLCLSPCALLGFIINAHTDTDTHAAYASTRCIGQRCVRHAPYAFPRRTSLLYTSRNAVNEVFASLACSDFSLSSLSAFRIFHCIFKLAMHRQRCSTTTTIWPMGATKTTITTATTTTTAPTSTSKSTTF